MKELKNKDLEELRMLGGISISPVITYSNEVVKTILDLSKKRPIDRIYVGKNGRKILQFSIMYNRTFDSETICGLSIILDDVLGDNEIIVKDTSNTYQRIDLSGVEKLL